MAEIKASVEIASMNAGKRDPAAVGFSWGDRTCSSPEEKVQKDTPSPTE